MRHNVDGLLKSSPEQLIVRHKTDLVLHILQPRKGRKILGQFLFQMPSHKCQKYIYIFLFLFNKHPDTYEKWQSTVKLLLVTFAMNVTVYYKKQKCNSESRDLPRTKTRDNYKHWLLWLHISNSRWETARDIKMACSAVGCVVQGEHFSTGRKLYQFWQGCKVTPFYSLEFHLTFRHRASSIQDRHLATPQRTFLYI